MNDKTNKLAEQMKHVFTFTLATILCFVFCFVSDSFATAAPVR